MTKSYPIFLLPLSEKDGGGFMGVAPDLPGCISQADTEDAALADIRNAMLEWIDEAQRLGRAIPVPCSSFAKVAAERERMRETLQKLSKIVGAELVELRAKIESLMEDRDSDSLLNELVTGTAAGCIRMRDGSVN